ncbi:MAG: ATP-dependent metallopeptidase FtsH/Yme1/Tma family protein [Candidatus Glassbacteria bacterium]|nr:ATP-dependent metallopeptidase FtsH/Yme1/Tma family protein [Candidatus Glassbacteria bacterium]
MAEKKSGKKRTQGKGTVSRRGKDRGPSRGPKFGNVSKNIAFWLLIILLPITLFSLLSPRREAIRKINYSQFMTYVGQGQVESVTIMEKRILGKLKGGAPRGLQGEEALTRNFETYIPFEDPDLVQKLDAADVEVTGKPPAVNWMTHLMGWVPWVLIIFIWLFFMRQLQGGGGRAFSFGKSKAKLLSGDRPKVTFKDVAGCDEAKQELEEVIDFLRTPRKFQKLGGRLPKGALLLGPPGTGKTLLARAVAGEADVPFFSMSGSDFVEMFVGVGASRVRDLFEQGKSNAPCIIFIDEIDAVGRHRGAGLGGGHDEREQTLNQLLVEMDGFESNEGVILIAATNRPDVLDPALLRPGRFDRQIVVDRPDVRGREGILKVHMKDIPVSRDVNVADLAKGTPGLSGAELESIVNEAALLAARRNRDKVAMQDFEDAKDKVMIGPERKSMVISEEEKRQIAVHESGHTLVQRLTPGTDPVNKVTIVARGMALGVTQYLPERDRHLYSKKWCQNNLLALMGGRCAEVLILGEMTTGAGNDLERATDLARKMVCTWGMSEAMGPLAFGHKEEQIFLGREIAQHQDYSEATARLIDREVKKLVEEAYNDAMSLLRENRGKLEKLADILLEREVLDAEEINLVVAGKNLPPVDTGKKKTKAKTRSRKPRTASSKRAAGADSNPAKLPAGDAERARDEHGGRDEEN